MIPKIEEFIKIPNSSRNFNPEWKNCPIQMQAVNFCVDYFKSQNIQNAKIDILQEEDRTPCLLIDIEGNRDKTILMYGHIDKQPPLNEGWMDGTGPYEPKIIDGKLYGRGGADDGYAFFACTIILKMLQEYKINHHRIILYFETDEESGSKDLVHFLQQKKDQIGNPDYVICLDSGCVDYEHMCLTTTLRGVLNFQLKVSVTNEGIHSGMGSGIIPDSFRIGRELIERFENSKTGQVIEDLYVDIPKDKYWQAQDLLEQLDGNLDFKFPFLKNVNPTTKNIFQAYLNRIWKPQLTLIGIDGVPNLKNSGNVLRPSTTFGFSLRLPPTLDSSKASEIVKNFFEKQNALYNAKIEVLNMVNGNGFCANAFEESSIEILQKCAQETFKKPVLFYGEGGSIPFMNELGKLFPKAQFLVTGVLGPQSNAHAPNEFLHLDFVEKLVITMARFLEELSK